MTLQHEQILQDLAWLKQVERSDKQIVKILRAIQQNEIHIARFLISQYVSDFSVDDLDCAGYALLHHVALAGCDMAMTELLQHRCNVNVLDKYGNTALHYAKVRNHGNSHSKVIASLKLKGAQ